LDAIFFIESAENHSFLYLEIQFNNVLFTVPIHIDRKKKICTGLGFFRQNFLYNL
jgi:hypothetical protein